MDLEATRASDAEAVAAALAGDQNAFGRLFGEHFDRTYDVAFRILRDKEQAAEVAQDTFLAAWTGLSSLDDPASFGGWVLRISRNRALNRLSRERRSVALGDEVTTAVLDQNAPAPDMEAGVAAEESRDLVWAASAALGERDASVLDLHLRHGLSGAALAEELGVNPNNANQILHAMKGRLENAVRAFVVWRNGNPDCADLRSLLSRQSDASFGVVTARMIRRHLKACGLCDAEQRRHLAPAAMFSAVPVLVAPLALRTQAAGALMHAGVPMGPVGSSAAAPDGAPDGAVEGAPGGAPDGGAVAAEQAPTGVIEQVEAEPPPEPPAAGEDGPTAAAGEEDPGTGGLSRRKLAALVGGAAIVMLLVVGGVVALAGDDGPGPVVVRATSTSAASTSTSTTSTTSSTTTTVASATTVAQTPTTVPNPATTSPPVPPTAAPSVVPPPPDEPGPTTTEPQPTTTEATTTSQVDPPPDTEPRDPKGSSGTPPIGVLSGPFSPG
ncbi:MAG: sigma-70 family RNA polymerase sigma factor [Microthrixaceae bacterium]